MALPQQVGPHTATMAAVVERAAPALKSLLNHPWERGQAGLGSSAIWWIALGAAMLVFSAFPIANLVFGYSTKDYGLWYQVGLGIRQGFDIYPRPESRRLFPFMYPPSAAAMLAWVSMLGRTGSLLALVIVNSAAWLASIGTFGLPGRETRDATSPAGRHCPVAFHHCPGAQHLSARSAQSLAAGSNPGRVRLPEARTICCGGCAAWPLLRPSRRFRSWPSAT